MEISDLPAFNAFLNFLATIFLMLGYYSIKIQKNEKRHKQFMCTALAISAAFLVSYLIYHYHAGSKKFPDLGWIKTVYLCILFPHIVLAAVMVPMILMTFFHAFRDNREKHKRIAKITFPIWMYVSVTGVIIYFMLYQWFAR